MDLVDIFYLFLDVPSLRGKKEKVCKSFHLGTPLTPSSSPFQDLSNDTKYV